MDARFIFLWEKRDGKASGILYEGKEAVYNIGEWKLVFGFLSGFLAVQI